MAIEQAGAHSPAEATRVFEETILSSSPHVARGRPSRSRTPRGSLANIIISSRRV